VLPQRCFQSLCMYMCTIAEHGSVLCWYADGQLHMMPAHRLICCFRPVEGVESPLERYIKASKELDDCPTDMEHYMVKPVFMMCNLIHCRYNLQQECMLLGWGLLPFARLETSTRQEHMTEGHQVHMHTCAVYTCAVQCHQVSCGHLACSCWPMANT